MPTAQCKPLVLSPWRKEAERPYPASASTQPKRTPAAMTRSISSIAIAGLVRYGRKGSGTPALTMRASSLVQLSGRNSRKPSMIGTSRDASVTDTSVWQFAFLPSADAYCGATPTDAVPFFGNAVSSMISHALSPPTSASACSHRSEEHTSELQSLMRISYAVFCLKKQTTHNQLP